MPRLKKEITWGDVAGLVVAVLALGGAFASWATTSERVYASQRELAARIEYIDKNGTVESRDLREELARTRIEVAKLSVALEATNQNLERLLGKTK